jgi:hypothetical protein
MEQKVWKVPSAFRILTGVEANRPETLEFEGQKWIVGEVKKDSIYPIGLKDLVNFYPLVVKYVQKVSGIDFKEAGVSLPTETWFLETTTGKENVIKQIKERIEKETGVKVKIFPQGVIALKSLKNLKRGERTLVIDGGFNTVNLAVVDEKGYITFVKTFYNEFGIRDLLERFFRPELLTKYPSATQNLQFLKQVFLQGYLDIGFEEINLMEEKQRAVRNYISALFERIKSELERAGEYFKQFAIVGGLCHYLPPKIQTSKHYVIGDEFSTVRGMAIAMPIAIDFGFGDIKIAVPVKTK